MRAKYQGAELARRSPMRDLASLSQSASARRATVEAAALLVLLLALLSGVAVVIGGSLGAEATLLVLLSPFVIELATALFALRLRGSQGSARRQVLAELTVAVVIGAVTLAMYLAGAALGRQVELDISPWNFISDVLVGLMLSSAHAATYLALRVGTRVWRWWDGKRRRRLLWALTHDQLVAVLVLMLVFGLVAALIGFVASSAEVTASGESFVSFTLRQLLSISLIGSFYVALTVAMLIGTLPLAILLAYLLVRRIVRRIELLTQATKALRGGDYAARVPVTGEDEIATLQADFNAMAATLDRTLHDLAAERDRVAGLLQAQRELVASVSHELRTPVATLRGYLDSNLQHDQDLPGRLHSDIVIMEHEVARLQALLDDLFALSRAEVGRLSLRCQPLDLGATVQRVVATVAPLAWQSSRIEVGAQVSPDLAPALADEARVEQILRNLLHNAIRHTPPGGIVVVVAASDDRQVTMQVNDTGSGIEPADLPRIWERFYRAASTRDADTGGTGLGLALVKELAEAMGGSVAVESELGAGSSFTVRLPRV